MESPIEQTPTLSPLTPPAPPSTASSAPSRPLTPGDARRGAALFASVCAHCHNVEAGQPHKFGPTLDGVYGTRAGRIPGSRPSEAMKRTGEEGGRGVVWGTDTLVGCRCRRCVCFAVSQLWPFFFFSFFTFRNQFFSLLSWEQDGMRGDWRKEKKEKDKGSSWRTESSLLGRISVFLSFLFSLSIQTVCLRPVRPSARHPQKQRKRACSCRLLIADCCATSQVAYLADCRGYVPGSKKPFKGVESERDRVDIVA